MGQGFGGYQEFPASAIFSFTVAWQIWGHLFIWCSQPSNKCISHHPWTPKSSRLPFCLLSPISCSKYLLESLFLWFGLYIFSVNWLHVWTGQWTDLTAKHPSPHNLCSQGFSIIILSKHILSWGFIPCSVDISFYYVSSLDQFLLFRLLVLLSSPFLTLVWSLVRSKKIKQIFMEG